jgi:phosphoribosylaminoimidazole-succinocarboxamide synthase
MPFFCSDCPDLKLIARGKVRDLYEVDEKSLLFVATDRISAFDVIMNNVSLSEEQRKENIHRPFYRPFLVKARF